MADTQLKDIIRGDTKTYNLTFTDKNNNPIPLYGRKIWMTFKSDMADTDADAAMQVVVTPPDNDDSLNGKATIVLSPNDTDITPDEYFYDIQIVTPGSPPDVKTLVSSKIRVIDDVTKSTT